MAEKIITITGIIDPSEMGLTLPHEHIMCDFIGADKTGKHRWDVDEVIETILPYVMDIKEQGVKTFVDCSPMYIGRDPEVLAKVSDRSGIRILTNTGWYARRNFLPEKAFGQSPQEISEQWIQEFEEGIEDTGIPPGFIKTAVEREPLAPMQQKIMTAAALTSKETGLTIATHTGVAVAASEVVDILESHGVSPAKWIFVHAQNEDNHDLLLEIAKRGAWIELDGIRSGTEEKHIAPLLKLLDAGFAGQVLISQDNGWYHVGEEKGGKVRPFTYLIDSFLPMIRARGVDQPMIDRLMITNPAKAFSVELSEG